MEAPQKLELNTRENENESDRIKKTNANTVTTTQKQFEENEIILTDLVSKIMAAFTQTGDYGEPTMIMKSFSKEFDRQSEIFKRLKNIKIDNYLDGMQHVKAQTLGERSTLNGALLLKESVEDCVYAVLENIVKEVENERTQLGQSESMRNVSATETEFDNFRFREAILEERKMIDEIEQIVINLIKEIQKRLIDGSLVVTIDEKPAEELELPMKISQSTLQSADSSTSVSTGQNTDTITESLHQTTPQSDSNQHASTMADSLKHAQTPKPSLAEAISVEGYLSDIVEVAQRFLSHKVYSTPMVRRAAILVNSILLSERSRQSNTHPVMDNLLEVDGMIEIVDGIGDLNEYLQTGMRKIFLMRRDLRRISSFIFEHLATLLMTRSEKFIKKHAVGVQKLSTVILADIKEIKCHLFTLFQSYFLVQRSFVEQSLKITTVPYELLVGDGRFTSLMANVKIAVIQLCGSIFSMAESEDLHEMTITNCKAIVRRVNVFTELVEVVDHTRDTEMATDVVEE